VKGTRQWNAIHKVLRSCSLIRALSPEGKNWAAVGASVTENKTVEHMLEESAKSPSLLMGTLD